MRASVASACTPAGSSQTGPLRSISAISMRWPISSSCSGGMSRAVARRIQGGAIATRATRARTASTPPKPRFGRRFSRGAGNSGSSRRTASIAPTMSRSRMARARPSLMA